MWEPEHRDSALSPDVSCTTFPQNSGWTDTRDLRGGPEPSQASQTKFGQQPQHTKPRASKTCNKVSPTFFFPWKFMLRRSLGGSGHTIFRETPGWAGNSPANRLEILSPASSSGWVLASVQSAAAFVTFPWQPRGRAGWTYCQQQPAALPAGRLGDMLKERQTGTREGADDRGTSGRASHMPSRVLTRVTPICATQGLHRDKQGLQMTLWNPTGAHADPTQAGLLSGYRQPLTMDLGAAHPHCLGTWKRTCGSPPRPTESETWGWAWPPAFNKPPSSFSRTAAEYENQCVVL